MGQKKVIKTTCKGCHGGCGVLVTAENGVITYIEGNPQSMTRGTMCAKGLASIQHVNHPGRLTHSLKRTGLRHSYPPGFMMLGNHTARGG
jgi:anaerobic selenocysteine-containing dehydrogenase